MAVRDLASKFGRESVDYLFGVYTRREHIRYGMAASELITFPGEYKGIQIDLGPSIAMNRRKDGNCLVGIQALLTVAGAEAVGMMIFEDKTLGGACLGFSLAMKTAFYLVEKSRAREGNEMRRQLIDMLHRGDLDDPEEREEILV